MNEIIELNGKRNHWYVLNGEEVFLIDNEDTQFDCRFDNLRPVDWAGRMIAYRCEDIDFELDEAIPEYLYSGEEKDAGDEIVLGWVIDKNSDGLKLIERFSIKRYYENEVYNRQLFTTTDDRYDWRSERVKFIEWVREFEVPRSEAKDRWIMICDEYSHLSHNYEAGCECEFNRVWEEI